ncbi:MAG TPA: GTPase [Candidatus Tectomicrobia bacterium]|nr:GTPase [Candidatus Tectomicrobia bacterium]
MADDLARQAVEQALEHLLGTVKTPRALQLRTEDRVALEQASARARAQLLGTPDPVLTVALAGGTGAGKSTLINALAGATVAESGAIRPTTDKLHVYHHRDVASGGLAAELAAEAVFVPHDRDALRSKVIVDTPDLDSFATHHRAATRALLKAAGLVLYVFSPQNYRDERVWSVLREEKRFSACAAVLNKIDLVTPEELEAITEDLRRAFARLGLPGIRLFRTVATAHIPGGNGAAPASAPGGDDLMALRAFLEHELQGSDVVRLLHRQQARVVAHLQAEIERVAPPRLLEQLDEATAAVSEHIEGAAARVHGVLADQLAAARADLLPLATLRQHERFRGPFRTWLAATDLLRFGLPGLVRRLLNHTPRGDKTPADPLPTRGKSTAADILREEAHAVQSLLYARGLPIDRWRSITVQMDWDRLMADIAATIKARFEAEVTASAGRGRVVVWVISTLGYLVPAAFVLIGLYVMGRDLLAGDYLGLPLLGHLFAMLTLSFLALQGLAGLFLPSGRRWLGPDVERKAVSEVLTRTVIGWIGAYRSDLEADLADLRAPLTALQSVLVVDSAPDEPTARGPLP